MVLTWDLQFSLFKNQTLRNYFAKSKGICSYLCLHKGSVEPNLTAIRGLGGRHRLPRFLFHQPPPSVLSSSGENLGFGKTANWVFSQSAPYPSFPCSSVYSSASPTINPRAFPTVSSCVYSWVSPGQSRGENCELGQRKERWREKMEIIRSADAWNKFHIDEKKNKGAESSTWGGIQRSDEWVRPSQIQHT